MTSMRRSFKVATATLRKDHCALAEVQLWSSEAAAFTCLLAQAEARPQHVSAPSFFWLRS